MANINGFGKRLFELRKSRNMSMNKVVADIKELYNVEFSKGNLSRWENGVHFPSLFCAYYLAKYYGVSLDYLTGLTNKRNNNS